jgi:hypothetical protein
MYVAQQAIERDGILLFYIYESDPLLEGAVHSMYVCMYAIPTSRRVTR